MKIILMDIKLSLVMKKMFSMIYSTEYYIFSILNFSIFIDFLFFRFCTIKILIHILLLLLVKYSLLMVKGKMLF